MPPKEVTEKRKLIEAIKTPVGFFSLIVLVTESLMGGLALASSGKDKTFLLYAIAGILVLLILLVAAISVFKPEAIWAKRTSPLNESFAAGLGEEIYTALDGYLSNLEDTAREEAYELLRETIKSSPHAKTRATREFCKVLVDTIIRRAELIQGKSQKMKGIVTP